MSIFSYLLDYLSKNEKTKSQKFRGKIIGYLLIVCGVGISLYFIFQYLSPSLGYFETGFLIALSCLILGASVLVKNRTVKEEPMINTFVDTLTDSLKNLHLKETLSPHIFKALPLALLVGFFLSQANNFQKKK